MVDFYPYFIKFRAFRTLHSPKRHVFLEVLVKSKAFYFSKRELRVPHAIRGYNKPWYIGITLST